MEPHLDTPAAAVPLVAAIPPADAPTAARHFLAKLAVETDPADLAADLAVGADGLVVVDTRQPWAFAEAHIAGAVNLPHATIDDDLARTLDPAARYVTYCWGPACNASTRGAANLAARGFRVKELIGGLAAWEAEGFPIDRAGAVAAAAGPPACAC